MDAVEEVEDRVGVGRMLRCCQCHSIIWIFVMKSTYYRRRLWENSFARMDYAMQCDEESKWCRRLLLCCALLACLHEGHDANG